MLNPEACSRAVSSRDPRFDGVFFVGITTTGIYCRPVCPARVSYPDRRRFFDSAAAAERSGFRPCLRCRPELAPGKALCDAVPRLARSAALRIAEGALNGQSVDALARELGVGGRQLRRAMERELGVSPVELAQTHRLLLAKCLLTDTRLPVTRVAYSSGFQSLRRFNSVFRERYRMSPSALRRGERRGPSTSAAELSGPGLVRLTLSYRPPLAWTELLERLGREALPGIEVVADGRYGRTVQLGRYRGVVFLEHAPRGSHILLELSLGLLPVLMPLIARLRRLCDLDAEPAVIDAHLAGAGLGELVRRSPGLRMPVAFDGFEAAVVELVGAGSPALGAVVAAASEAMEAGWPGLTHVGLTPVGVASLGARQLAALGVPGPRAEALVAVARAARGALRLEPGAEPAATLETLCSIPGIDSVAATAIVMRAMHWPDAFNAQDVELQRLWCVADARQLELAAEAWRPWRAHAATYLRASGGQLPGSPLRAVT
ncbi:MAG TPA: AlkA N-terminal domain-containing protein [Gemmatimonadales bacterium]|nr:AlkA N-terminal domain-containing protein [Gemmatimonadales bacterium]